MSTRRNLKALVEISSTQSETEKKESNSNSKKNSKKANSKKENNKKENIKKEKLDAPGKEKKKKENSKQSINSDDNSQKEKKEYTTSKRINGRTNYKTHDGVKLTVKEAKFIDAYVETGNQRQAVIDAGYDSINPGGYAQVLLKKEHIAREIGWRLTQLEDEKTASAKEILEFYTRVMRGEEKDQFGLDVTVGDRIKAANELAKRKIDVANKVQNGKDVAEVRIKLDWEGMKDDTQDEETT